jgi:hypothetical protein
VKPSKFLTARSTVIVLFIAISVALLFASAVPQRGMSGGETPQWVGNLPGTLQFIVNLLGLDNIIGSNWFALLIALFWISLVISTVSQYSATKLLANRIPSNVVPPESIRIGISPDDFSKLASATGYRLCGSTEGVKRFVKNPIGFWGNFLLHVGLVTAVLFSLVYVLTQHRVLIRLTGQEITKLTSGNVQEIRGVLPLQQRLPYSIVLKTLEPRFWSNDKLESLTSELYITDKAGDDPRRVDVALSDKTYFGPYIVYQANAYGRGFDLTFQSGQGEIYQERLYIPYPIGRDRASYGERSIAGTKFTVKGKFYADPEHKSIKLRESPLSLRLYRGKELLGDVSLTPGPGQQLGPFSVRLGQSEWWTDILLDGTKGTSGIFSGFAMILVGVLCSYCLVPREIIVRTSGGGVFVQHVTRRFAQFYREEFDEVMKNAYTSEETES